MTLKRGLLLIAVLVVLPYVRSPIYRFPAPAVFSGTTFLNPYAGGSTAWQRANLHAHGRAWNGLTNGHQSDQEIVAAYRKRGYSIAGVSDYQRIAANDRVDTLPLYEHGYNIDKRHQLAIGARQVEWLDFPLWQSLSDEQFIINRVRSKADLVALAHPSSYGNDDLQQLGGYELMEVVNGPFVMEDAWDAALSAGHLVWGLADDDTHDLNDPRRSAVAWNMIGARSTATSDVIEALRVGRTFAVMRTDEDPSPVEAVVPQVAFSGHTLTVSSTEPSTFLFIGQDGAVRQSTKQTMQAAYTLAANDTYVRAVVRSSRTATFVNPIVRYDGIRVPAPAAVEAAAETWLKRAAFALAAVLLAAVALRRQAPSPAARPAASVARFDSRRKRA